MLPFFNTIISDLQAVENIVSKQYKLKTGSITDLVPLELENIDYQLRPALLLAAARAYGRGGEKIRMVAGVIQFIYLATQVHSIVEDEDPSGEGDYQFPVLVGDYLYGHFFLGLCKAQALEFLAPLSETILNIHEASIQRKQGKALSDRQMLEILEKEHALLCAVACKTGAQMAGASEMEQELFWQFGRSLGLGIAALSNGLGRKWVKHELENARQVLVSLPVHAPSLGEFYSYLETELMKA